MMLPTTFVPILLGILMAFLLLVFLISMLQRTRLRNQKEQNAQIEYLENIIASKSDQLSKLDIEIKKKKENIDFFLAWMLEHSVITPEEYNRLLLRSLPYL